MAFQDAYRQQVALLIRTIPFVAQEQCFALKGGTAINLFVRDLPRLSVDIDLTYLPVEDRASSLTAIDAAMARIKERIEGGIPGAVVAPSRSAGDNIITKPIVRSEGVQIKIEVTPVLRGTVFDPEVMSVVPAVEDTFGFAEMQVVSFADLYAGKIVAALDRQHPRDLFDVRDLLANEGISDELLEGVNLPFSQVSDVPSTIASCAGDAQIRVDSLLCRCLLKRASAATERPGKPQNVLEKPAHYVGSIVGTASAIF